MIMNNEKLARVPEMIKNTDDLSYDENTDDKLI